MFGLAARRAVFDGVGAGLADGKFDQVGLVTGVPLNHLAGGFAAPVDVAEVARPVALRNKIRHET